GVMVDLIRNFIMLAGIIIMMFTLDVGLAFTSISCVPIIAGIMVVYRIAARKNFIRMKGLLAKINGFLAENISGMKLVQIFNREKEKYEELRKLDGEYFKCSLREVVLNSFSRPVVDIVNNLTIAVLIIFCMGRILEGSLEIGVLFAFIAYIKQFFEPISEISEKYTAIQSAIISSERIFDILDKQDTQEDMIGGKPTGRLIGGIKFEHVWFAYEGEGWVLKDVSFSINPGETVAFVGATGSGKTTIISLIMRFYDIQKGRILIDGQDIREYRLEDLRRQIAVVLQDVFLFAGDIRSNIRLNNKNISDEDIEHAARYVSADSFIESLPGKYDEEVKERGCTFSAGQKQMISFVRAVAFNPAVLVLDEATASIDTGTEQAIREAMSKISRDRTSVIIAHR
ncbi:MAG: ABC transporter ATP-binding protein/permease, partial [Taibaiella sp.]|nr:ABC transporter ATP-binding protein/permease [Taibaiella sp.]